MRTQKQPRFREAPRPAPELGVWKDVTGYSRDEVRVPTAWTMRLQPDFAVTVTNGHIYHRGEWVMHCAPWFDTRPIPATSEEQAKRMALDLVAQKLDGLAAAMRKILT